MGAFCERLVLAAARDGPALDVQPALARSGSDLHVADVELRPGAVTDPLAAFVADRATNRSRYTAEPLPAELVSAPA